MSRHILRRPVDSSTSSTANPPKDRRGNPFYRKKYGALPPPDSGAQTDLGHNLPWEAGPGVALDVALRGAPTCTLFRTDYPGDVHRILAIPAGGSGRPRRAVGTGPSCFG